jgi:lambda family phage portal protein
MSEVRILGADGQPLPPSSPRTRVAQTPRAPRNRALSGGNKNWFGPAYDAADIYGQHMSEWQPYLWSPDSELNMYRDRIVSRVRDLVRNDGWASGAVTRILDNAVGAALRPIPKPNHLWLAKATGNSSFDATWAKEFGAVASAYWNTWAGEDLGKYSDAARNQEFADQMRTAFRHKLVDGDALAYIDWKPERVGRGRARYATCVQLIDPDRLSNPQLVYDQHWMRGGVQIDEAGAAIGYWIRRAHAGDWFSAVESVHWDYVPRETPWGRPWVVHDYDCDRASQHRGGAGIFTPVLQRLKMLVKYDSVELDSAIVNAMFGAYIESPFDPQLVAEAFDTGEKPVLRYQQERQDFHRDGPDIVLSDTRLPILFPGEAVRAIQSAHPTANFQAFQSAVLRNSATAVGLSAQQITNDWSDVNYSSARGALLEAWKTLGRRRHDFSIGFCAPIRATWMEESFAVDGDAYPWPSGVARDFPAYRAALARARWIGPALGWLDPVAEVQASIMRMDGALGTLENECAEQGMEFEEVLDQRAYELKLFDKLKIPRPEWAGALVSTGDVKGAQQKGEKIKPPTPAKQPEAE